MSGGMSINLTSKKPFATILHAEPINYVQSFELRAAGTTMIHISTHLAIPEAEIEVRAIRAQGAGGQHVNKVSSAIHLRFDIKASSLPNRCKEKLLLMNDQRVSSDGVIIIKAQRFRSQDLNRQDAFDRLRDVIRGGTITRTKRTATKPTKGSHVRRLARKTKHGKLKALRGTSGVHD